jgi:hypothetical protein
MMLAAQCHLGTKCVRPPPGTLPRRRSGQHSLSFQG